LAAIGIISLTLITAIIHLVILNVRMGRIDPPFILNGLGYLALLAALYLPLPIAKDNRRLVRWLFIGFTIVTILAWFFISFLPSIQNGYNDGIGYFTKLDELALIVLLWIEGRQS
jgi:hypothetical protein